MSDKDLVIVTVREPDGPLLQIRISEHHVECGLPNSRPNIEMMKEPTLKLIQASIEILLANMESEQ